MIRRLYLANKELHDLTDAEKIYPGCQGRLHKVSDDIREQLEIIPQQMYVVEHIHPQYACRQCETMRASEKERSPVPKSMAGASLITAIIINKYEYHLPLYRQSQIFQGQGLEVPDNTLGNWVMRAGEGLRPLDEPLRAEIGAAHYLQVDETPVKLLTPEKKAYMWAYLSPLPLQRLIRFRFDLSRSGSGRRTRFRTFPGCIANRWLWRL